MIRHTDDDGYNFLLCAAESNTKEIVELAWNEIGTVLGKGAALTAYLRHANDKNENIVYALMKGNDAEKLTFLWRKLESHFLAQNLHHQFKALLHEKALPNNFNALHFSTKSDKIEVHKALWRLLLNTFENRKELMALLVQKWDFEANYIHSLAAVGKPDVVEFILNTFKEVFSRDQIKKNLKSKELSGKNLLHLAALGTEEIKTYQLLWKNVREVLDPSEIVDFVGHADENGNNVLLCVAEHNTREIAELTWNEIKTVFSGNGNVGLTEFLRHPNKDGENILHALNSGKDEGKLKFFWVELEKYFQSQNLPEELKQLVNQKATKHNLNVLQTAALCDVVEFHETFWELLVKTFVNREEFKDLVMQQGENGDDFVHLLVTYNIADVIEFTLKKIKEVFSHGQYLEIIKSKGYFGRHLLHVAAIFSKDIKIHQFLWRFFRELCKSDEEFLEILKEIDGQKTNVFHNAAFLSTADIFDFMVKELEFIASREEIRTILSTLSIKGINILQLGAVQNKSLELNKNLWKFFDKYFSSAEITGMIQHVTETGHNLLLLAVEFSTTEVVELTLKQIKNTLEHAKLVEHPQELDLAQIISQKTPDGKNILHIAAYRGEIELHEALWEFLLNTVENREELKNLIKQKDEFGCGLINRLVALKQVEIFELTLNKIKRNLTEAQYQEILSSTTGELQTKILQVALANSSEDIKIYQSFLKIIRKYCDASEVLDMIRHPDVNGNNILLYVENCSKEIAEVTWNEIKAVMSDNENAELTEYLKCVNNNGQNILHVLSTTQDVEMLEKFWNEIENQFRAQNLHDEFRKLVNQQNSRFSRNILHISAFSDKIEFHEALWELLCKTIENREELKDLVMQNDVNGNNYLHNLATESTADIIELTLKKLRENLNLDDYVKILRAKGFYERNLLQSAAIGSTDFKKYQILLKFIKNSCKSDKEFLEYFNDVDENGSNLVNTTAVTSTSEIFRFMIENLEKIASREEIKKILSVISRSNTNILQITTMGNKSLETHQILWKNIQKYFDSSEIMDMVKHICDLGNNLLYIAATANTREVGDLIWDEISNICGGDTEKMLEYLKEVSSNGENSTPFLIGLMSDEVLKYFWTKSEKYFNAEQFMELVQQKSSNDSANILHFAAECKKIEVHETLWELLLSTFKNREQLKDLLVQRNDYGDNSVCYILINNEPNIIEFTFSKIKENFNDAQYEEILRSKTQGDYNLLHVAAYASTEIETHPILWKIFQDFCKSDEEFLDILREVNNQDEDVFGIATSSSTAEIFNFMVQELEKLASREEIREILSHNLLESAAQSQSFEIYQSLWKLVRKYFDSWEILDIISRIDDDGDNLLLIAVDSNEDEIVELTIEEVKKIFTANNYYEEKLSELWSECQTCLTNLIDNFDAEAKKLIKLKLDELVDKFRLFDSYTLLEKVSNQEISIKDAKFLHRMAYCDKIGQHEAVWKVLLNNFDSREELKDLILQNDDDGNNFAHLLIQKSNIEIIELTFGNFKQNFSTDQYYEILNSKGGEYEGNLLQAAVSASNDIKIYQFLWKIIRDSRKSDQEFLKFLNDVDSYGDNIFHLAANFATKEIFEFMIDQLQKVASFEEIQEILRSIGSIDRNMLQIAAEGNESSDLHLFLWTIFRKDFNSTEIVNFINHCDESGDRLIHNVVAWNTKEIAELTWNQIKEHITTKGDQIEYLKTKGYDEQDLLERSLRNESAGTDVRVWVENLMIEYEIVLKK